ncbi:MAG: class I SAM-dependent methyltransferase [Hyphomonadaceae bacterium]
MPITPTETLDAALNILAGGDFDIDLPELPLNANERVIEVPWAAAMLRTQKRVLDIGFTFADADYLGLLLALRRAGASLDAIDIIEPARVAARYPDAWREEILGVPVRVGDVRAMALPEAAYDAAALISVIEHVGFDAPAPAGDKSAFDRPAARADAPLARDGDADKHVMEKLAAALAPGGRAVLTVPMGEGGARATQDSLGRWASYWLYSEDCFAGLAASSGFAVEERRFFRRQDGAWREVGSAKAMRKAGVDEKGLPEGCGLLALRRLAA